MGREKLTKNCGTKRRKMIWNWPKNGQFSIIWNKIWSYLLIIMHLIRLSNWNLDAVIFYYNLLIIFSIILYYSKEIFFVNFSFFAKNGLVFFVFREKFQTRKMCSTSDRGMNYLKMHTILGKSLYSCNTSFFGWRYKRKFHKWKIHLETNFFCQSDLPKNT